jgi:hypothetical protein
MIYQIGFWHESYSSTQTFRSDDDMIITLFQKESDLDHIVAALFSWRDEVADRL